MPTLNRLAEGLRVIEGRHAFRPGQRRAGRATQGVAPRHRAPCAGSWGATAWPARDALGDVGRERIAEPDRRDGWLEVLGASFGPRRPSRWRVLEETAKLDSAEAARLAKAMRYQTYDFEKALVPLFDRRRKGRTPARAFTCC